MWVYEFAVSVQFWGEANHQAVDISPAHTLRLTQLAEGPIGIINIRTRLLAKPAI